MIRYLKKISAKKSQPIQDEFDIKYGFILKYGITSKKSYNEVKAYWFQYHQASE